AFLGILFGLAVSSGVDKLQDHGLRRGIGAPLIVVASLALLVGFGAWLAPTIHDQTIEIEHRLPDALDRADQWVNARQGSFIGILPGESAETPADSAQIAAGNTSPLRQRLSAAFGNVARFFFPFLSSTVEFFASIIIIIFMSIYIAVDPELYRRGMMALFPAG